MHPQVCEPYHCPQEVHSNLLPWKMNYCYTKHKCTSYMRESKIGGLSENLFHTRHTLGDDQHQLANANELQVLIHVAGLALIASKCLGWKALRCRLRIPVPLSCHTSLSAYDSLQVAHER